MGGVLVNDKWPRLSFLSDHSSVEATKRAIVFGIRRAGM